MAQPHNDPFDDPSDPFRDAFTTVSSHQDIDADHAFQTTSTSEDAHDTRALNEREERLKQKEQELRDRERDLETRQQQSQRAHRNNFPPCFPIMYLDISTEIPLQHQSIVWWIYREWLLFEVTLVLNFIACLCVLFSYPPSVTSGPTNLGIALTEMFTHTAASFFLWYRPVYNAYMKEVSLYYALFLIFNGFHILYTFYMAIGIPSTGGAGLILLVTLFSERYIVSGVFTLLASICWVVMGFMALFLYKKTYDHYRAAGHTMKEAKNEALVQMGRSEAVRGAAFSGIRSGMSRS